jgi:cell division protein FtsQ
MPPVRAAGNTEESEGRAVAQQTPRPRKKRKKRSAIYGPLSFVIICAALIFGMSVFFRVSQVEVVGAETYSAEEIIEASGIEVGDNLFFINRFSVTSRIYSRLPYVENVVVTPKLPNRVVLEVTEGKAAAYVVVENELWILDRGCKALGQAKAAEVQGLIRVDGIAVESPAVGEVIAVSEEDASKVSFLSAILKEIMARDMQGDVTAVNMSNIASPSFDYLNRFTVRLGKNESVDYKFELLLSAVGQLAAGDTGTIDLSVDKRAHFSPD